MKRLIITLTALAVVAIAHPAEAKKKAAVPAQPATKSVQVKGYTTKSGKYVPPHTRVISVKKGAKKAAPKSAAPAPAASGTK